MKKILSGMQGFGHLAIQNFSQRRVFCKVLNEKSRRCCKRQSERKVVKYVDTVCCPNRSLWLPSTGLHRISLMSTGGLAGPGMWEHEKFSSLEVIKMKPKEKKKQQKKRGQTKIINKYGRRRNLYQLLKKKQTN